MVEYLKPEQITAAEEEQAELLREFPAINEIQNAEIQEGVINTWIRCWRLSGYKRILEIPLFNETNDGTLLAEHTRAVAKMAINMAKAYRSEYGLPLNNDYLISGALILDVDRPLCFVYDSSGHRQLTRFGRLMPPGCGATALAIEAGLPLEVASIADCHSYISRVHAGCPEGVLLDYAHKAVSRALIIAKGGVVPVKTGYGG